MNTIKLFSGILLTPFIVACATTQLNEEWIDLDLSDKTYFSTTEGFLQKQYKVVVPAQSWIEFMVAMKKDNAITYSWSADISNPELLTAEFHGHTEKLPEQPGNVMLYNKHNENQEQGALIAPFDGNQGWYLKNDSETDITLDLSVAGFFEEVEQ